MKRTCAAGGISFQQKRTPPDKATHAKKGTTADYQLFSSASQSSHMTAQQVPLAPAPREKESGCESVPPEEMSKGAVARNLPHVHKKSGASRCEG